MYGDDTRGMGRDVLNKAFSCRQQMALKLRREIDTLTSARLAKDHDQARTYELECLQDAYAALSRTSHRPAPKLPLEEIMGFKK